MMLPLSLDHDPDPSGVHHDIWKKIVRELWTGVELGKGTDRRQFGVGWPDQVTSRGDCALEGADHVTFS